MKEILFVTFLFLGYSSVVAQREVCESEEYQITDFNSIDKCVIIKENDIKKEQYNSDRFVFLKKKAKNKKGVTLNNGIVLNKDKRVSIDLIKKILIEEKTDETIFNTSTLDK